MIETMITALERILLDIATQVPLPVFSAVASFLEEVIAPIPSGPVMLLSGSLAALQGYTLWALLGLAVIAAIGKLAGALVVYGIADKAEDIFSGRFAAWFGITHAQIESFGARLGNGPRDYIVFTVLRALPIVPSVVLSLGGGALKMPLPLFITGTLVGSVIRDAFFLYVGYVGLESAERILASMDSIESVVLYGSIGAVIIGFGIAFVMAYQKKRRSR